MKGEGERLVAWVRMKAQAEKSLADYIGLQKASAREGPIARSMLAVRR